MTHPLPQDSAPTTLATVVHLRLPAPRPESDARRLRNDRVAALAGDYVLAVRTAAGRRGDIGAATDRYLAEFTAGPAPYSRPGAAVAAPGAEGPRVEGDVLEAWVARVCLLGLVPVAVCLRTVGRPGWAADELATSPGVSGLTLAAVLTALGSVWTWRVTSPLCRPPTSRLPGAAGGRPGGVSVVTLLPFLTCLLPAAVLTFVTWVPR